MGVATVVCVRCPALVLHLGHEAQLHHQVGDVGIGVELDGLAVIHPCEARAPWWPATSPLRDRPFR